MSIAGSATLAEQAAAAAYRALALPYDEARLMELVRLEALRLAGAPGTPRASAIIVRSTFESLDQLQRSALELAHGGGMRVAEIAAALVFRTGERPCGAPGGPLGNRRRCANRGGAA